ncbi:hypothetical protein GGI10_002349 [Coemansia sp. RSA 2530]|nr:hypothetical protein GGI10_002349 [Coemansia sp. RSA 2530]
MSYPSATSLVLELNFRYDGDAICGISLETNDIAEFAHSLWHLIPAVTSVAIDLKSTRYGAYDSEQPCTTLVSELTKGGVVGLSIDLKTSVNRLKFTQLTKPGLTSIVLGFNIGSTSENTLVYRNASTLKELQIGLHELGCWRGLLYGDTQTPTAYPRLTSLTLVIAERHYNTNWALLGSVDPFPTLSTLDFSGHYPFNDDVLFRGNGETLKNLSLPFSAITTNALGRLGILERLSATRMNSIRIYVPAGGEVTRQTNPSIEPQVHLILETAVALRLTRGTTDNQMFRAIKTAPSTAVLQHLHLDGHWLGSSHILAIILALSSLISLACLIKGSVYYIEKIPTSEHPSELYTKFFSPNSCFRKPGVLDSAWTSTVEVAIVAMQIAVVHPGYALVGLDSKLRESLRCIVSRALRNEPFKPYADSFRHLV